MKIAYIMLCHKNAKQVGDLLNQLNNENADFFIHVDKKASDFDLPKSDNIFVVPDYERVDVRWASKSMVIATLAAINYLFRCGRKYDYVFLISGQDYPIKSNDEIEDFLQQHYGANFIEVLDHSDKLYTRYKKRNDIAYPSWMLNPSKIVKSIKKTYIYISGGYGHTFSLFRRENTAKLEFEFGSQWWCLTYDCLKWITTYITNNKEVLDFFDYALTPDECLFQMVFMASPYSETRCDKLTYLEWDSNQNNPRILKCKDLSLLMNCKHLFARKFDANVDDQILQKLKQFLKRG